LEIARILYSFLISNDKEENYAILYDSIEKTTGIYGPIYFVASQSTEGVESVIPETKLNELKKLVIQKANFNKPEVILSNHYFLFILYRYKEWATAIQFNHFIDSIKRDYSLFLQFCNYFVSTTTSTIPGKLTVQKQKGFNLKEIGNFLSVYEIKEQIELIQKKEDVLSDEFKEIIILLNTAIDDFTKNQPDRRVALLL